jgi:hypothetical protein
MAKKLSLSQVLDELDVMNDSDSGSEFEDNAELDADYDDLTILATVEMILRCT